MAVRSRRNRRRAAWAALAAVLRRLLAGALWVGLGALERSAYPRRYSEYVEQYAREYQVEEALIYAVIKTESGFDPQAVSSSDAKGLMQITPATFDWISAKLSYTQYRHDDLFEPQVAVEYGTFLLSYLLEEFGDTETALAAYHAGRGVTNQWLADERYSSDGKTLEQIPYPDTAHYVRKVERAYQVYQRQDS